MHVKAHANKREKKSVLLCRCATMRPCRRVYWIACLLSLLASPFFFPVDALRLSGSWDYRDSSRVQLKYVGKFGVQKGHEVWAYGNSVARHGSRLVGLNKFLVLAFVDTSTWDDFYGKAGKGGSCESAMSVAFNHSLAPEDRCSASHGRPLYRLVPCLPGRACQNQGHVSLVRGSNLTFSLRSPSTQYYYIFLAGCLQSNHSSASLCRWFTSDSVSVDYDLHIVNNNPDLVSNPDPLVYEFSYDQIGLMVAYVVFAFMYLGLLVFHVAMNTPLCTPAGYKHHCMTLTFSLSLFLDFFHVLLVMTHYCVFAVDGVGVKALLYMGQALNFLSDWLLILVLILIGKGWQITTVTVRWKKVTLVLWMLYIFISAIFFSWIVVSGGCAILSVFFQSEDTSRRKTHLQTALKVTCTNFRASASKFLLAKLIIMLLATEL